MIVAINEQAMVVQLRFLDDKLKRTSELLETYSLR